ncbi:MAG: TPM domain-containing protein [Euryarchaeota archaeon]|nr:TPM domain-containing protein [Euryarchaeota archaeon]
MKRKDVAVGIGAFFVAIIILIAGIVAIYYVFLRDEGPVDDPNIPTIYPYANDHAGVLSSYYLDWIDAICYEVDLNTSCEIAVLVVNDTSPYDINYYALRTFQKNGIGKEGKDNGVLVLVATGNGAWRIEVGYGVEWILTDTRVDGIAEAYLEPSIEAGTVGEGIVETVSEIGAILIVEYDESRSGNPAGYPIEGIPLDWTQWFLIFAAVAVLALVTKGRILWPIIWLLMSIGGRGRFGGGRSGGGGAFGKR